MISNNVIDNNIDQARINWLNNAIYNLEISKKTYEALKTKTSEAAGELKSAKSNIVKSCEELENFYKSEATDGPSSKIEEMQNMESEIQDIINALNGYISEEITAKINGISSQITSYQEEKRYLINKANGMLNY